MKYCVQWQGDREIHGTTPFSELLLYCFFRFRESNLVLEHMNERNKTRSGRR